VLKELSVPNLFCLTTLFLAVPAFAQQPQPPAPRPAARPITLDVTVDDRSGAPVAGLARQDFNLLNNKHPQAITSFRMVDGSAGEPTHVILLVDAVNIGFTGLSHVREDIDRFLHGGEGTLAYPTTLAILEDKGVQMQQGYSRNGNELAAAFDKQEIGLRDIRRSAGFYGADDRLGISLQAFRQLVTNASTLPGRKIVLFVSPGWPILSGPGVDLTSRQQQQIFSQVVDLSNLLLRARTTVYAINPLGAGENLSRENFYESFVNGVEKANKTSLGDLALQVLALHSGGLVLNGSNDTTGLLNRALAGSSITYQLTFDPPPSDHAGEYHHLEIKVDRPGLNPRTLDGYYDTP
jgi:VWFA-related protein